MRPSPALALFLALAACGPSSKSAAPPEPKPKPEPAPVASAPAASSGPSPQAAESAPAPGPAPLSAEQQLIVAIARDIEKLAPACPQLSGFRADQHADTERLIISYQHHTHLSEVRGGWRAGVPSPDPDGITLYIDLHDPSSKAQLHTQPLLPMRKVGSMLLMMVMSEGEKVPRCFAKVDRILERHGGPSAIWRADRGKKQGVSPPPPP